MEAIVQTPFKGVPDGETQTRQFEKGDRVEGDLAGVAVREKWAKRVGERKAAKPAASSRKAAKPAASSRKAAKPAAGTGNGNAEDGGDGSGQA